MKNTGASQLAEADRLIDIHLKPRDGLEPVPAKVLLARLREGRVTVLDVRPTDEFAAGHLQGALNIPLEDLERMLDTLPQGQEIVAYCRGPYCWLAYEAVARLRRHGFQARRLEFGFPQWRHAGYPTAGQSANAGLGNDPLP